MPNGAASPIVKPLVDYPDDDDDDGEGEVHQVEAHTSAQAIASTGAFSGQTPSPSEPYQTTETPTSPISPAVRTPPERLSEKRRREEDEEDELVKLASGTKRRSSSGSGTHGAAGFLRAKRSLSIGSMTSSDKGPVQGAISSTQASSGGPKKIAINLGLATLKSSPDTDSTVTITTNESNEKENQDDHSHHDNEGG